MCGRFAQCSELAQYMQEIDAGWQADASLPEAQPSYNLAPSQDAWAIVATDALLAPKRMHWGYRPEWAKPGMGASINARIETASSKPYFRTAWRESRCIIPADCFYEWQAQPDGGKQPVCIRREGSRPMLFAGLYAPGTDAAPDAFAIVTTAAGDQLAEVHHRMPVILKPQSARDWLDCDAQPAEAGYASAARSCALVWHPVSKRVNEPRNNEPSLMQEPAA